MKVIIEGETGRCTFEHSWEFDGRIRGGIADDPRHVWQQIKATGLYAGSPLDWAEMRRGAVVLDRIDAE